MIGLLSSRTIIRTAYNYNAPTSIASPGLTVAKVFLSTSLFEVSLQQKRIYYLCDEIILSISLHALTTVTAADYQLSIHYIYIRIQYKHAQEHEYACVVA